MSAQVPGGSKASFIKEAVERALRDAQNDRTKAARLLEERVRNDIALRETLLAPFIRSACEYAIRRAIQSDRRKIWAPMRAANLDPNEMRDRVVALAAGTLLMFRLPTPGNKPLGEATQSEIYEAVRFYETQSQDMIAKARWLSLVAQYITSDKVVNDVLTEERLRELQREASRAA